MLTTPSKHFSSCKKKYFNFLNMKTTKKLKTKSLIKQSIDHKYMISLNKVIISYKSYINFIVDKNKDYEKILTEKELRASI